MHNIQTLTGLVFDYSNPRGEMIRAWDIVWPLSRLMRWAGQIEPAWDVLSHCALCWQLARRKYADLTPDEEVYLLLHDASEAYMGDIASPLKALLPDYQNIEDWVQGAILERFGVNLDRVRVQEMHDIDMVARAVEAKFLDKTSHPPVDVPTDLPTITRVDPEAYMRFLYDKTLALGAVDINELFHRVAKAPPEETAPAPRRSAVEGIRI